VVLVLIPILILIFILFLRVSKATSKFIAIFIDFLVVGGVIAYLSNEAISLKIASGKAVYFWNLVFGVGACIIYYFILSLLVIYLPKIASLINYLVSWIGTFIIYFIFFSIFNGELPQLLNDEKLSVIINIIIVTLLSFITYRARRNIFDMKENEVSA